MPAFLTRRRTLSLGASGLLTAACQPGGPAPTAGTHVDDADLAEIGESWLKASAALNPVWATLQGDHAHDGELDDLGESGRRARSEHRAETARSLAQIDRQALSPDAQVDALMLEDRLEHDRFMADDLEAWAWDPLIHSDTIGDALYGLVAREYAPLPERLIAAASRLEATPRALLQIRSSLSPERTPCAHAETYARQNAGAGALVDELILSAADALGPGDRSRLQAAADAAKSALREHQAWIETALIPHARGDFRLGADAFDRKLALSLGSRLSRKDIRSAAATDLERLKEEMYAIARDRAPRSAGSGPSAPLTSPAERDAVIRDALERAYADRPAPEQLFETVETSLAQSTAFARAADLLTLPDAPVRVITMPEFRQGVSVAYCDSPGPLDRGLETFYAVSPIPSGWSDEQTRSFLREYNRRSIDELTVHEAMPGHYVQIWRANGHPSRLRAVLGSGTFIEGWACYAQDVMLEAGHGGDDPLRRLVNRKWALRVVSNALLDQSLHVDGMDEAAAMDLMVNGAFQEEREAAGKWIRAQVSSTQLSTYYTGWIEHHRLRTEMKERLKDGFSLKAYHDGVLAHGSPPVRLVRALLLGEAPD